MLIPAGNSTARHCKKSEMSEDEQRITAAAFSLKQKEDMLSVLWVEYFSGTNREEIMHLVREDLERSRQPKNKDVLGIVGVGEATQRVSSELSIQLEFRHTPGRSKSHSSIQGMKCPKELAIAKILADIASREFYPAVVPTPPPPKEG